MAPGAERRRDSCGAAAGPLRGAGPLLQLADVSVLAPGGAYEGLAAVAAGAAGNMTGGGKKDVTGVCGALRQAMQKVDESRYIRPICVSFVRSHPADVEGALEVVRQAKERELAGKAGEEVSSLVFFRLHWPFCLLGAGFGWLGAWGGKLHSSS